MTKQIMGEIGDVVPRKVGDRLYYFGTVGSDKVKLLTVVPVVEESRKSYLLESTEDGYQRPGTLSRMRRFSKFLKENPNSVVPPVLLSGRDLWEYRPDSDKGIGTLVVRGPAAVIDGQHRLGGYVAFYEDEHEVRPVDFILLPSLTRDEEMKEFVIVNNTQKGVPKSLTVFLGDEEPAQVAWGLNIEEDSPFKDRITRTTMARQHLFALHSVAKQVERLFAFGALNDLPVEEKVQFMIRFWDIIADVLPDEWSDIEKLDDTGFRGKRDFEYKLLELTGLIAWSLVGKTILGRSYNEAVGMNWDNVRRLVQECAGIEWEKEGRYRGMTGEVGGKIIADDMERMLPPEGRQLESPENPGDPSE